MTAAPFNTVPSNAFRVLDHGYVRLLSLMGNDLTVVNAARVSFHKQTSFSPGGTLSEADARLIRYLAQHNHWTPFGHVQLTFCFKMPIAIRNQFMRSTVGIVYTETGEMLPHADEQDPVINEVSRRYVDEEPEFYYPSAWRGRPPKSLKQGSAEPIDYTPDSFTPKGFASDVRLQAEDVACIEYARRIEAGVAPELARMVLPIGMYTEFWATMSLVAAARIYLLRVDPHAQQEVRDYAATMNSIILSFDTLLLSWCFLTRQQDLLDGGPYSFLLSTKT